MERFDVIVVGGGPAGSLAARHLAQSGCHVLLLEATDFSKPRVGETFAPNLQEVLGPIGLWPAFLAREPRPSHAFASAWGESKIEVRSFIEDPYGVGWHVDRADFDRMLFDEAAAAGAQTRMRCRVGEAVHDASGKWRVGWSGNEGEEAAAVFLINASGRGMGFSRRMGDELESYDELVAVGCVFEQRPAAVNTAFIESVELGWWYTSPLPGERCIALLMTDLNLVAANGLRQLPGWRTALAAAPFTSERVGALEITGTLTVRLAHSQRVVHAHTPDQAPAGDAAASFDPLNGEGIVRSVQTGLGAARVALRALEGDTRAVPEFLATIGELYGDYLEDRTTFYGFEQRWPQAPFWERRSGSPVAG